MWSGLGSRGRVGVGLLTTHRILRGLRAGRGLGLFVTLGALGLFGVTVATAQSYTPVRTRTAMRPVYSTTAPRTYVTRPTYPSGTVAQAPTTVAASAPAATTGTTAVAGDYGFTAWLNGVRARYGLAPVSFDGGLANWAAVNNAQQAARGLGHFVMGPARRQNCAVGNSASIGSQWMNSPAHRAALLDPTIRWIGLAGSGMYWTLNVR